MNLMLGCLLFKKFNESCSLSKAARILSTYLNPHMHEIFLQRYCMKWVPGDPLKEMIN